MRKKADQDAGAGLDLCLIWVELALIRLVRVFFSGVLALSLRVVVLISLVSTFCCGERIAFQGESVLTSVVRWVLRGLECFVWLAAWPGWGAGFVFRRGLIPNTVANRTFFGAGGSAEISRWRQPPESDGKRASPGRGGGNPSAPPGRTRFIAYPVADATG